MAVDEDDGGAGAGLVLLHEAVGGEEGTEEGAVFRQGLPGEFGAGGGQEAAGPVEGGEVALVEAEEGAEGAGGQGDLRRPRGGGGEDGVAGVHGPGLLGEGGEGQAAEE